MGIDLPCNSFTRARRAPTWSRMPSALRGDKPADLWGLPNLSEADQAKVEVGNALFLFSIKVIRASVQFGVPGYMENPRSSRVWLMAEIQELLEAELAFFVDFDMCQYGTAWKKPTRLLIWGVAPGSVTLKRCCAKGSICSRSGLKHQALTGCQRGGFATTTAQVYPLEFVAALLPQLS